MAWMLYFFAAFGFAWGVGYSHVTLPFREWLAKGGWASKWLLIGLECPGCLGWHIGYLSVLCEVAPISRSLWHCVLMAFVTAGANILLARIAGLTGEHA